MNFTLFELSLTFVACTIAALIWQNLTTRERALKLVQNHCKKLDMQMLDDSIYGVFWRPSFSQGYLGIKRKYRFTFTTTGEVRYKGEIEMLGSRQVSIHFEPHRI